ncbi:conserved hypothetical protein [Neospora caninum Liverpool]|uniref:Uncharacterized protein n=1 Tax=Neospora caninum (strain Liverpool) TaxID=572307 RepID=F0VQD9_NEOCL|nr:conserved hypothetical protein [Neospora caninum Liverpool]CBZ55936.1 conserved hypothetical protein [Neospora caninum Liverpool]CEL70679.1 TPA: hypothetical protein BN1204_063620 [Neospora caninum Liverpool]|eukprot:XP_003885962.1 conserved hypothetical protein [Neospora caninum Liverpool]
MDLSGRVPAGLTRNDVARGRATQLVRPATGTSVNSLRRMPDDALKVSAQKAKQMQKANIRVEEETRAKDPTAATIQALVLEMREAMQQLTCRNRRLEEELRRYRASFKSAMEQQERFARNFHDCQAELHKERQRSEFQEREFRTLCAQLTTTIQGFAADHEEIANVCSPPYCMGGKGLRELHGLAQILRVKLALGVYAHLRADKAGAETRNQEQERLSSCILAHNTAHATNETMPVMTVGQVRPASGDQSGRLSPTEPLRHPCSPSPAVCGAIRGGGVALGKRVSINLDTQDVCPPSRLSSHSSRSSFNAPQPGDEHEAGSGFTAVSARIHEPGSRESTESARAEQDFARTQNGGGIEGDKTRPHIAEPPCENVECGNDCLSDSSSVSERTSDSEFLSSSSGSSPRLSHRAPPPPKSLRPKFVPSLSTAAAGTGSWMSGNREPSEYPQGM